MRTIRNHTFSIKPSDKTNFELIVAIRKHCFEQGVTFSHVCLKALAYYAKDKLNVKV